MAIQSLGGGGEAASLVCFQVNTYLVDNHVTGFKRLVANFVGKHTKLLRDYSLSSSGGSETRSNGEWIRPACFKMLTTVFFFRQDK